MLIKEYRIPLPMSVEEYRIAQLYMIQVSLISLIALSSLNADEMALLPSNVASSDFLYGRAIANDCLLVSEVMYNVRCLRYATSQQRVDFFFLLLYLYLMRGNLRSLRLFFDILSRQNSWKRWLWNLFTLIDFSRSHLRDSFCTFTTNESNLSSLTKANCSRGRKQGMKL